MHLQKQSDYHSAAQPPSSLARPSAAALVVASLHSMAGSTSYLAGSTTTDVQIGSGLKAVWPKQEPRLGTGPKEIKKYATELEQFTLIK